MNEVTGYFDAVDGCRLYYEAWLPAAAPRATLVLAHGLGEHTGRYTHLVDCLVPANYAVFGYHYRGHGRSGGRRGHIDAWADYRRDLAACLNEVSRQQPGIPTFLYGHSMGSLVVLDYLLHHPAGMRGAIASGVPIEPVGIAKPHLVLIAKVMSRVRPTFGIKRDVKLASQLSRDPAVVAAYDADPLMIDTFSARWAAESWNTIQRIKARPEDIHIPILFLHGGADPVNAVGGVRGYVDAIASTDKRLIVYPGSLHEPHNDLDYAQVGNDVVRWLNEHL